MTRIRIISPKTNRPVSVRAWRIEPRDVLARFKSGEYKTAQDLSYALLNQSRSVMDMSEGLDGDSAQTNFALCVFDNALDWTLGLAVLNLIRACRKQHNRLPKPFRIAASRAGDVFLIAASGKVLVLNA